MAVAVAAAVAWIGACDGDEPSGLPSPSTAATTAPAGPVVDWAAPGLDVDLGDGFRARHCEGDAPLLCIEQQGVAVGFVELLDFPAGDGMALADRVEDLYRSTAADREQGCPPGYRFDTDDPRPAAVAGSEGLRYGFTGTMPDGRPSERTIGWMFERDGPGKPGDRGVPATPGDRGVPATPGDRGVPAKIVSVLSAAADEPDGCLPPEGGGVFTVALLEAATPSIERLVAGSRLPGPLN